MRFTVGTSDLRAALRAVPPHAYPRPDYQDLHRIRCDVGSENLTLTATNRYTAGLAIVSIWDHHDGELGPFDISPTDAKEILTLFKGGTDGDDEVGETLRFEVGDELVVTDTGGLFTGKSVTLPRLPHGTGYPDIAGVVARALHNPATEPAARWIADGATLAQFAKASRAYGRALAVTSSKHGNQLISCGESFLGVLVPSRDEELAGQIKAWHHNWAERLPKPQELVLSYDEVADQRVDDHEAALTEYTRQLEEHNLLRQAADLVVTGQFGSAAMVQRKLRIRHARAGTLMDELERAGIVGPVRAGLPRQILLPADVDPAKLDELLPPPAPVD